jgi:hypothetical protein
MTDEGGAAKKVGTEFTQHGSVNHGAGECVRGNIRTKTVESYSSIMKRDLLDVSLRQPATFEANLAEFDFRKNERNEKGPARRDRLNRRLCVRSTARRFLIREISTSIPASRSGV